MLPDLDVLGFRLGVHYDSGFGHRGVSHSLMFAVLVALLGGCCHRGLHSGFLRAFLFLLAATASHGIFDAFTNGGLGISFLWPFSSERYFAPFQVIEVSPLSVSRFFSARGASVLLSELLWVWVPCLLLAIALATLRRSSSRSPGARARA